MGCGTSQPVSLTVCPNGVPSLTHASISAPGDVLSQYFQNYTCVPFTNVSQNCELGNFPNYVVNVTGVNDLRGAIAFAKKYNIRIVIKNTGHEYVLYLSIDI